MSELEGPIGARVSGGALPGAAVSEWLRAGKQNARLKVFGVVLRFAKEKPLGAVGGAFTLVLLLVAIFANLLAPYGVNQIGVGNPLQGPYPGHWLGTDNLGRDLLTRIIYGARISVIVGLSSAAIGTIMSTVLGMLSGYLGGTFDMLLQRFVDAWLTLPGLIVLMAIMSITGPGMVPIIVVLGVSTGIASTRIIRGATLSVKASGYIAASIAIGCSTRRILFRHVLPNILAPIIVLFSILVPFAIMTAASLSFLGLGIPAPTPTWGGMLSGNGITYMYQDPWMAVWPGLALTITVFSVNVLGDAIRDVLDPRLKGGVGRYGKARTRRRSKQGIPEL